MLKKFVAKAKTVAIVFFSGRYNNIAKNILNILKNKIALITGGTSGMGAVTAKRFLAESKYTTEQSIGSMAGSR